MAGLCREGEGEGEEEREGEGEGEGEGGREWERGQTAPSANPELHQKKAVTGTLSAENKPASRCRTKTRHQRSR